MSAAPLTFPGSRCQIGLTQVTYLGHVFSADEMGPDPNKITAVQDWVTPTNYISTKSFLGLVSYYHHYIHCFAAPLYCLTNNGVAFEWSEVCQSPFSKLKGALMQPPILEYPDLTP